MHALNGGSGLLHFVMGEWNNACTARWQWAPTLCNGEMEQCLHCTCTVAVGYYTLKWENGRMPALHGGSGLLHFVMGEWKNACTARWQWATTLCNGGMEECLHCTVAVGYYTF